MIQETDRNDQVHMSVDYIGLFGDSPAVLDIARDAGPFWEFRLTAALLRQQLKDPSRKWRDLKDGLYTQRLTRLNGAECMPWFSMKLAEASDFLPPLEELYTKRMVQSWGEQGEPGDVEEIAHVCGLIGKMASELVRWEEDVAFTRFPEQIDGVRRALSGAAGHQLDELGKVPDVIDNGIDQAEQSDPDQRTVVNHTIAFSLPAGWQENVSAELSRMNDLISSGRFRMD